MSLIDSIDAGADVERLIGELAAGAGNPRAQLAAQVGFDRRLFERGGPMLSVILEGRRQEPDLAAAYAEGRDRGERGRREFFQSWPKSAWRRGISIDRALDVYAVVASFSTYEVATVERGWSPDDVERWWLATLTEQLLA
jgi:hypothetical protein